ncbi:MAG: biotin--[acetyl-CoA-carboxylase] ligase [Proteobacteria bacterium]|nr:biotin--[acetyl-CoA-carboxylase] ligase [Pseudomonadota bacterium]
MLFLFAMYPIHSFDTVPSTNSLAKKLAKNGAPHGTAVIAANQTEGRGRLGKNWHSVVNKGLYCSIIVRPRLAVQDFPKITLAAGLGVAEAIDRIAGGFSQLKWPNDIFLDGKKCGGILTESSALNEPEIQRFAVIGIGLNLSSSLEDFPEDLRRKVTSIFLQTGTCPDASHVFLTLRDEVLQQLELFYSDGFRSILAAWKQRDFLLGKHMECVGSDGKIITGVSLGPDEEGQLHVKDGDGQIHTVLSGDISLAGKE